MRSMENVPLVLLVEMNTPRTSGPRKSPRFVVALPTHYYINPSLTKTQASEDNTGNPRKTKSPTYSSLSASALTSSFTHSNPESPPAPPSYPTRTPFDFFFETFPAFPYDRSQPAAAEFRRMCRLFGWAENDQRRVYAQQGYDIAMRKHVDMIYATDANEDPQWNEWNRDFGDVDGRKGKQDKNANAWRVGMVKFEQDIVAYRTMAEEHGVTRQGAQPNGTTSEMDEVVNNYRDPEVKEYLQRKVEVFKNAGTPRVVAVRPVGDVVKGLTILLCTPFALVAAVFFAAAGIIYSIGSIVKGVGSVLTFGAWDDEKERKKA